MRIGIDARKIADFGIGTYIRGLLGGLLDLGTGDEYVAFAPARASVPSGVEHVVVEAPHYSLRELLVVGRAADRARLDVFHAPHYVLPYTRTPAVVTIHDLIHLHQPMRNRLAPIYARAMIRRAVRRAGAILTVSDAVRRDLEREIGAVGVVVTPNGVTPPPDDPGGTIERRHLLFVGNDKPHKNVDRLVAAFAGARREMPAVSLVLVGGAFQRFHDRDGIIARGFVDDRELSALYRSSIALVIPSLEEGFGLPALEAMAHATPVITSTAPALVEVTGDAALHVDAGDVDALRAAMLRLARDETLRDSLVARGLERASRHTWKRCAELTRGVYELLGGVEHRGTSGI